MSLKRQLHIGDGRDGVFGAFIAPRGRDVLSVPASELLFSSTRGSSGLGFLTEGFAQLKEGHTTPVHFVNALDEIPVVMMQMAFLFTQAHDNRKKIFIPPAHSEFRDEKFLPPRYKCTVSQTGLLFTDLTQGTTFGQAFVRYVVIKASMP